MNPETAATVDVVAGLVALVKYDDLGRMQASLLIAGMNAKVAQRCLAVAVKALSEEVDDDCVQGR